MVGTLSTRHFGWVPFSVPSWPWYHSWPSYLFRQPGLDAGAALVALARAERLSRVLRLAGSLLALAVLVLAVAALAGGPAAWAAPLAFAGEYPGAVGQVGPIPAFIGEFPAQVPTLPDFAAQHPPFATVFYVLVDRVCPAWTRPPGHRGRRLPWPAGGGRPSPRRARCEQGSGSRSSAGPWPPTGACSAAPSGGRRPAGSCSGWPPCSPSRPCWSCRSWRARPGRPGRRRLGLGAALGGRDHGGGARPGRAAPLTTGYDVFAAVAAVDDFWSHAPGTEQRVWWVWIFGDLIACAVILGFPLTAAPVTGLVAAVRERAWGSFEVATGAALLAAASWATSAARSACPWSRPS